MGKDENTKSQSLANTIALNGIISLAISLKVQGFLNNQEIDRLYTSMTKPLALPEFADNEFAQKTHGMLDDLFIALRGD